MKGESAAKENPEEIRALGYCLDFLKSFAKYLKSMEAIKLTKAPINAIIIVTIRSSGGMLGKIPKTVPLTIQILSFRLNCIFIPPHWFPHLHYH